MDQTETKSAFLDEKRADAARAVVEAARTLNRAMHRAWNAGIVIDASLILTQEIGRGPGSLSQINVKQSVPITDEVLGR